MPGTINASSTIAVTLSTSPDNPLLITDTGTIDAPGGIALDLLSPLVWTVQNYGLLQTTGGYADALRLGAGGTLVNQISGQIIGGGFGADITGGIGYVNNSGTMLATGASGAALTLGGGGVVTNTLYGVIEGGHGVQVSGTVGTVINSGLISGNSAAVYVYSGVIANQAGGMITSSTTAAQFGGYGVVTNAASATIASTFAIVTGTAPAKVDNAGVIIATPARRHRRFPGAGGNVSNASGRHHLRQSLRRRSGKRRAHRQQCRPGSRQAPASPSAPPSAASARCFFSNTGTIAGSNGGIRITQSGAIVTNSGLIDGDNRYGVRLVSGGYLSTHPVATFVGAGCVLVFLVGSGTVTNAGTFASSGAAINAVYFRPGYYLNHLVVEPSAVFEGTVNGGNSVGASAVLPCWN